MSLTHPFTIMDGGMGQELLRRDPRGRANGLWSAQALFDAPELVAGVHADFIEAGARLIITNNYSTIPSYLGKTDLADRYLELTEQAARIARNTADQSAHPVQVAGSMPPLNESYRVDLVPADAEAEPIYTAIASALRPFIDLYLCETMSCIREAVNAVAAARRAAGADLPVWVAWTLDETPGNGLRSGESIADAVAALAPYAPDAYLFNCTSPEAITAALTELRALTDKPIGAYPNCSIVPAGWTLDNNVQMQHRDMTEDEFVAFATTWRNCGAGIIGGCCGIGPDHIAALSQAHTA